MFDWIDFFTKYNIEYTRKGHTTNNVGISCPFCGDSPDKMYMGVSLVGKGWSCWKFQKAHGGRSPYRLIIALIGCTYSEAVNLVKDGESVTHQTTEANFINDFTRLLGIHGKSEIQYSPPPKLSLLPEFKPVEDTMMSRRLVYPYLQDRGYKTDDEILDLCERFELLFAYNGQFAYRVVAPIYMHNELITWTGRTIVEDEELRYRTLSHDPAKARKASLPQAMLNIKDTIFDYDNLMKGGDVLVVTEGPFDAMRITFLGERNGIVGTCLYNKTLSLVQSYLLADVIPYFNKSYVLFDSNAQLDVFRNFSGSLYNSFERLELPVGYKDPAVLDTYGFNKLFGFTSKINHLHSAAP